MTGAAESRGVFITLEGIEGVGKSTQARFIVEHLEASGVDVDATREPGGTPLAESIRRIVLDPDGEPVPPRCELLLMFASRSAHVANRIRPALDRGTWVVCDRFTDATLAYQGAGRGMPTDDIRQLATWVHPRTWPDITFLLDAPVEVAIERQQARGGADRFERERAAFFERVRQGYRDIAAAEPERVRIVDASGDVERVRQEIRATLDILLAGHGLTTAGRAP